MWAHWDSGHYITIASNGYQYVEGQMSNVAFFPLYPLLIRITTGGSKDLQSLIIAGWLISNVATASAFVLIHRLVTLDWSEGIARRTIWYLALFPTSFYLSVVYSEGLFLGLTVAAFYCARQRHWVAAGILGGLSAAARLVGVFLLLPLAYEWYTQKPRRVASAWPLLFVPCGILAYMLYLKAAFGDPLLFAKVQAAWGRITSSADALQLVRALLTAPIATARSMGSSMDLIFVVLSGVLFVGMLKTQRPGYLLYTAYSIVAPLSTLKLISAPRLVIVIFPLFIALAQQLRREWTFYFALAALGLVQALFVARWSLCYWLF
jgi:Gpi18-like mannosyltransferase